jgi:hypothetical protein
MFGRSISRVLLPMLAGIITACSGSDVTAPVTLGDLAGRYEVTNISVYFKSDPPFRVNAGGLQGVQVTIEASGNFTVEATAATGLSPESGTINIGGNVLTVSTNDTGSVFLHAGVEKFSYREGVLSLIQDIPQFVGEDLVTTTVTTELTKR